MSDLTTHSLGRAARTETLPPAESAKGDAKTQALKGRNATLDAGVLSRLAGVNTKTLENPSQGITARQVRVDAEKPGPQRIAQAPHDGKPDVEVFGKGGIAARGAEPTYANAKAHEQEPQYANAKFAKGEVESGYSVLKQEPQYANANFAKGGGKGEVSSGYSVLKQEAQGITLKNSAYGLQDKTSGGAASRSGGEDPYLTPRSDLGSRGTFRTLSDRMASVASAPPPRLERLRAAVQKLFDAVKSLVSRVAEVRSRPTSQPPRVGLGGGESWRNPDLARRALPQTPPQSQRAGAAPSGYESGVQGQGAGTQTLASQTPISSHLSATESYEERLRTDMRNLGDAEKATVRRLAGEIDRIVSRAETLDIDLTDQQDLQIAQNRHDIALVLENYAREQGGGGNA